MADQKNENNSKPENNPKPENALKPENNQINPEMAKLRNIVLKWITEKREAVQSKPAKAKPPILAQKTLIVTPPINKPIRLKPSKKTPIPPRPANPAGPSAPRLLLPPGRKKSPLKISAWIFALMILTFLVFSLGLYLFTWQNQATGAIARIIPYPAAIVDGRVIYYFQWQKEVSAVNNFYLKQKALAPNLPLPDLKQIKKSVLQRLIDEKIIDQLAKKYRVTVLPEEIEVQTGKLTGEIGSQAALVRQIQELYGWNLADFQNEIIRPRLLKDKLDLALMADSEYNKLALAKIQIIAEELKAGQKSFAELAKLYSQDITGVQGGDLGYFGRNEMLPEIETSAFGLNVGQTSEILETRLGYHLIRLEEKLTDESGQAAKVRASQIFIKGKNLDDLINDFKTKAKIWPLVLIW